MQYPVTMTMNTIQKNRITFVSKVCCLLNEKSHILRLTTACTFNIISRDDGDDESHIQKMRITSVAASLNVI